MPKQFALHTVHTLNFISAKILAISGMKEELLTFSS